MNKYQFRDCASFWDAECLYIDVELRHSEKGKGRMKVTLLEIRPDE
jgi:hypothetical protein